jgi:hypothetical protein
LAAEIVQDHGIARTKGRQKNVRYMVAKAFAIDRPFNELWRINAVVA